MVVTGFFVLCNVLHCFIANLAKGETMCERDKRREREIRRRTRDYRDRL